MTEDQANQRWCPFVSVNGSNVNIDNPIKETTIPIFRPSCIASACMMWRWEQNYKAQKEPPVMISVEPVEGYCGLAEKTTGVK